MRRVPREAFVDPGFEEFAYEDSPLPIGEGQSISQPYIVARMIDAAELKPGETVLDVGAGSGYAAAVASQIAGRVFAIERHRTLGESARKRLQELGFDNIDLRIGDGTKGWREAAPFDVILVAAGGPEVPRALKEQLAMGGRLIIPVGPDELGQILRKLTRTSETHYETEDLGAVMFVPLIGEQGWADDIADRVADAPERTLPELIAAAAEPLPDIDDPAFGELFGRFADRRVVLLGEASHGTSEFYRARAAITRHLVERHGFTIVAVEADWPDAAIVDNYVRHRQTRPGSDPPFQRFPRWMWRNTDVDAFIDWLRDYNGSVDPQRQAGFYGLDIYNMSGSIAAVLDYLGAVDPDAAVHCPRALRLPDALAKGAFQLRTRRAHGRLPDMRKSGHRPMQRFAQSPPRLCGKGRQETFSMPRKTHGSSPRRSATTGSCTTVAPRAWNLRDIHMFETLNHILETVGPDAKAVVWAHNSHIGDARYTEMGVVRDELNVGQLCRQRFGNEAALIGFGTHAGTVAAARNWDGDMEIMPVRHSHHDSYERLCHDAGVLRFLLDFDQHEALSQRLLEPGLERFIGVIYRPETELLSHYAEASLSRQFDAFVWFDETSAITPLGPEHKRTARQTLTRLACEQLFGSRRLRVESFMRAEGNLDLFVEPSSRVTGKSLK